MPKVKINKQLKRPDGQNISSGSIADSNPRFVESAKTIVFPTKLYYNQTALDNGKTPVPVIEEFQFNTLNKECSDAEWDAVNNDPNAGELTTQFYQEAIEAHIGNGNTEPLA